MADRDGGMPMTARRVTLDVTEKQFQVVFSCFRSGGGAAWHQDAELREIFLRADAGLRDMTCEHEHTVDIYEDVEKDVGEGLTELVQEPVGNMCVRCGGRNL